MTQRQVPNSFDEVVAFAEVEKLDDAPVKHYSAEMHVRLAFSAGEHLWVAATVFVAGAVSLLSHSLIERLKRGRSSSPIQRFFEYLSYWDSTSRPAIISIALQSACGWHADCT
jgi:hypothetical protein